MPCFTGELLSIIYSHVQRHFTIYKNQLDCCFYRTTCTCSSTSFIPQSSVCLRYIPLQTQGPPLALTVALQWLSISRIISSWGLVISCCRPGVEGRLDCEREAWFGQCLGDKSFSFELAGVHTHTNHWPPPLLTSALPCQLVASWNTQTLQPDCDWALTLGPFETWKLSVSFCEQDLPNWWKSHKDGNCWVASRGCKGGVLTNLLYSLQ